MDAFTVAYLECALWTETDNSTESGGEPLDKNYSLQDFSTQAINKATEDCAKFQLENADLLTKAYELSDDVEGGYNFWLSRCGHGTGWWDRGLGEIGDTLHKKSEEYKEVNVVVGDDGKLYLE